MQEMYFVYSSQIFYTNTYAYYLRPMYVFKTSATRTKNVKKAGKCTSYVRLYDFLLYVHKTYCMFWVDMRWPFAFQPHIFLLKN